MHDDCIRAMRYPPNAYRKYLETPEKRKQREKAEAEWMAEGDDDDEGGL